MTRMLPLAALALACAFSISPAFAMAYPPKWGAPADAAARLAVAATVAAGFLSILTLAALAFDRCKIGAFRFCCTVGVAFLLLAAISPAFAAEVVALVTVAPAVILPWGDWVVAIGQALTSILLPILVGLVGRAVYQVAP